MVGREVQRSAEFAQALGGRKLGRGYKAGRARVTGLAIGVWTD